MIIWKKDLLTFTTMLGDMVLYEGSLGVTFFSSMMIFWYLKVVLMCVRGFSLILK